MKKGLIENHPGNYPSTTFRILLSTMFQLSSECFLPSSIGEKSPIPLFSQLSKMKRIFFFFIYLLLYNVLTYPIV